MLGLCRLLVGVCRSIGPVGADLSKQRDDGGRLKPEGDFNNKENKLHVGREK